MPIEIKELHIKINVDENRRNNNSPNVSRNEKEKIIAICVEQIMEILAKKEER